MVWLEKGLDQLFKKDPLKLLEIGLSQTIVTFTDILFISKLFITRSKALLIYANMGGDHFQLFRSVHSGEDLLSALKASSVRPLALSACSYLFLPIVKCFDTPETASLHYSGELIFALNKHELSCYNFNDDHLL